MNNLGHVPFKRVLSILVILFSFLLFFTGYALKEKTSLSSEHISLVLLGFILISSFLIHFFYKRSLAKPIGDIKAENAVIQDYVSIRKGGFGNQSTTIGKWYGAAVIVAVIFPFFAKIITNYIGFARPDYVILILGYVIIFVFTTGIIITKRKK